MEYTKCCKEYHAEQPVRLAVFRNQRYAIEQYKECRARGKLGWRFADMGKQILNWQDGVARVVNNRALYAKLLGRFAESQGNAPAQMAQAIGADNLEEVRTLAHTLKGTAANLGAEALAEAALHLEEAAKAGEDMAGSLAAVQRVMEETLAAMQNFQA